MSAIWSGTISRPTMITNRTFLPGNTIQAIAYAANAAIVIGMTVEGMVINRLLKNAFAMSSANSTRS